MANSLHSPSVPRWQDPADAPQDRHESASHASVLRTIATGTGQITLIVNDDSDVQAEALAALVEAALVNALRAFAAAPPLRRTEATRAASGVEA